MKRKSKLKWKKIDVLENKETEYTTDELAFLYTLSKSKNLYFRTKAAELLVDHHTNKSEDILYHMTFDREYVVTLNAVDSLCIGKTLKSLQRLDALVSDEDYMIRGYAVMSYCDVYLNMYGQIEENVLNKLRSGLSEEANDWTRAIILEMLYLYDSEEYLDNLLSLLYKCVEKQEYEAVWCIINIFAEIVREDNRANIIKGLQKIYGNVLETQQDKIDLIAREEI